MERMIEKTTITNNIMEWFKSPAIHQLVLSLTMLAFIIHMDKMNFMLSHSILETLNSSICFSLAIIVINSYKLSRNNYFVFLGIVFGFVSFFNFLHEIAYMGAFINSTSPINLSMQINIAYRLVESFSILASFIFLYKSFKPYAVFYFYLLLSMVLLYLIFNTSFFPTCFASGSGMTPFANACEWAMMSSMAVSIFLFIKHRRHFGNRIAFYMSMYLLFIILTRFTADFNTSIYNSYSLTSHVFKFVSYYFLYKALVEKVVKCPLDSLCQDIAGKNSELERTINMLSYKNVKLEKIKEELQASKDKYKKFLEFLPDAVFIRHGQEIVYANTAAVKLFKAKDAEELLGKAPVDLVHPCCQNCLAHGLEDQKEGVVPCLNFNDLKLAALDGTLIDADVKCTPLGAREEDFYITVIHDLFERKNAENAVKLLNEARENEKLKTEFFANLSHELKTPINVIYSALQVMDLNNGEKESKKYNRVIRQNCYRLLRLVNNLIDSTRIDAGFLKLHMAHENIVPVVEDVVQSISSYVESKGISLIFDTDVEEKYMDFDPDAMERIVLNLLSNAVKFSQENGTITVNIVDKGSKVAVCVKDDGIGIPESQQALVFERFKQVDKSFSRNKEGSGIGLSLVKSLVELHKGSITLKSEEGEGSEFIVELPVMENFKNCAVTEQAPQSSMIQKISIEFSDIYL